ncbi:F-box/kelch-repeat protein At3g06240-like [Quercus lobata]|uniref:F-box/kelch-repeat protein At3g06240-like n=1 Tax=Quercus lobata TaxID=97700 RepID=UPI0012442590|nr:F-box/kelch-repeat protein At3g06240-like [Quercus lobata]
MSFDANGEKFREIAVPEEIIRSSHWITLPLAVVDDLQVEHLELHAKIVGSYNGLLCLADIESTTTSGNVIYLWNPSIRKFKRLPKPCLGQLDSVTLGFAYHSENNDYKVVRISISHSVPPSEIEVYTLSSDSWRRIEMPLRSNIKFYDNNYFLPIPLVSGALHWMAGFIEEEEKHCSEMIMCFDVNCEKFRNLEMPNGSMSVPSFQICLASFKEKLAVITYGESEQSYQYTIWVMREYGVHESWHKLFVLPFGRRVAIFIGFTENGSLLICRRNDQLENKKYKFVLVTLKLYSRRILIFNMLHV